MLLTYQFNGDTANDIGWPLKSL